MNKYFHRNFRAPMVKFSIAHISLMLGLIFAIDPPTLLAQQDILIIRPMGNNKSVVSAREFIFEVEASAFEPILEVKINGEVQDIAQKSWVSVKKTFQLQAGENKIIVEATTDSGSTSEEFVIAYQTGKGAIAEITIQSPPGETAMMFTEQASEYFGYFNLAVWAIIFVTVIYKFSRSIRLVPTQSAYLVERLGKYRATLGPGIHLLLPFFDRVTFIQDLKEESIGVDPQECFTSDNVKVEVDGVIYLSVTDPVNSSYGVTDYRFAATQLAQTTTRSMIGTLDLDRTFEERDIISAKVVEVLSEVGQGWGITVHRYEIKNIVPPSSVREAMERQVTAERERRAIVARSEGDKQSRINRSEGLKEELVNRSEGEMQRRINEAEGKAEEIEALSEATAESIELLAAAISQKGGKEAVRLQLTQNYLSQLSHLADQETSVLLPADLTQLDDLLSAVGLSGDGGGKA